MKYLSLLCLLLLTGIGPVAAQPGVAAELDRFYQQAQREWDVPGMSVGIIHNGEVVLAKGYGVRRAGGSDPVDGNTLFAIASNTKAMVAAALGILVTEGKLSWDDPVRKHLPYFALYDEYVSDHTTISDLLSHRAGLGTFSGDVIWYKSTKTPEEVIRHMRYLPQAYPFRAGYGYSNLMFITAGEVIRAVSGKGWDVFLRERLFAPLGMERTRTSVTQFADMSNVADPHKAIEAGGNRPIPYVNWDNMGAAGGVISSANDMLHWLQLHLAGGIHEGDTLLVPAVLQQIWTVHNPFYVSTAARQLYGSRHFSGYGLGWSMFDYGGVAVYTHSGGYDGMYSRVFVVPELNLGFVNLTNGMKGLSTALMYHTLDRYLGRTTGFDWKKWGLENEATGVRSWQQRRQERLDQRVANTQPTFDLEKYTGIYTDPLYGDIRVELAADGKLRIHFADAPDLTADLSLSDKGLDQGTVCMRWDVIEACFDFRVPVLDQIDADVRQAVAGSEPNRAWMIYAQAADFLATYDDFIRRALDYAIQSTSRYDHPWNWWLRAQLEARIGDYENAVLSAQRCLTVGQQHPDDRFFVTARPTIEQKLAEWRAM